MTYFDRNGECYTPSKNDTVRARSGAFCVCLCGDKILVNLEPHAPDNPSLPGGGIEEDENAFQAAQREFLEETGISFPQDLTSKKTFIQDIKLYADDVDEYWNYNQTYFLFHVERNNSIYFEGQKKNPSGYYAFWDDVETIQMSTLHYGHKKALKIILDNDI